MNKTIVVLAIAGAFVIGTLFSEDLATAAKPVTDVFVTNIDPIPVTGIVAVCPLENVQHWDKIIYTPFFVPGDINIINPQGHPDLIEDRQYDIKIIDDPNTTVDLNQAVANKLNQIGYKIQTIANPEDPFEDIRPDNIMIGDVEYAIVCVELPPT